MRGAAGIMLGLGMAACQPQPPQPGAQAAAEPTPVTATSPPVVRDVIGGWRLVEMGGRAWPGSPLGDRPPYPITMTVGETVLVGQSQCVSFWRRYERSGQQVRTGPYGPVTMCARGLSSEERAFEAALAGVNAARVEGGRLRLSGTAGELVFEDAPLPTPPDFTGAWVLSRLDGRPASSTPPLTLEVTGDRIKAQSQCVSFRWRYRQTGRLIESFREDVGPICERGRSEQEERFERLVDGLQDVTLRDDGTLVLSGALAQAEFRRAR